MNKDIIVIRRYINRSDRESLLGYFKNIEIDLKVLLCNLSTQDLVSCYTVLYDKEPKSMSERIILVGQIINFVKEN